MHVQNIHESYGPPPNNKYTMFGKKSRPKSLEDFVVSDYGEILFELYDNGFYKKGPGHTARYTGASIQGL